MRALVTGGTGFIGFHVARKLCAAGHRVRVMTRRPPSAWHRRQLAVEWVYGDLANGQGLLEAVRGVDAVFHVAALYTLDRRQDRAVYETNVGGTRRLLEAVRAAGGVGRLVYTSSTATVALRADGQPADESGFADPDHAAGAYKRSKILAERLVLEAAEGGLDAVVVNPSAPVGWGDHKPTPTGRIVLDMIERRMPAYVDTGLNLVDVEDVAAGHLLAFERGRSGHRYILGHENLTLAAILERVARLAGVPAPRRRLPYWVAWTAAVVDDLLLAPVRRGPPRVPLAGVRMARRPMYFTARKAVECLGLPQTPVDRALEQAVRWFSRDFGAGQERTGSL